MQNDSTLFVGLDVHKDSITVAYALDGGEVQTLGKIGTTQIEIERLCKRLQSKARHIKIVYEAGPCGYGLQRRLAAKGFECMVCAPTLIPRKPGERVKTDRRDELKRARQSLKSFLLSHGVRYVGSANWGPRHRNWLSKFPFGNEWQDFAFNELRRAIEDRFAQCQRLEAAMRDAVPRWGFYPAVLALQAMRGIQFTAAVGLLSELGDLARFAHPRQLMAWLGVTPSEYSSGGKRRQGAITKTGNSLARKLLIEAAWSYRHTAKVSPEIQLRHEGLPKVIIDRAWDAQVRLCRRYRKRVARGKNKNVAIVALARELGAFIWDIGRLGMAPSESAFGVTGERSKKAACNETVVS